MKKLLVEVYKGQPLQVAEAQSQVPDGMMRMTGVFGVVVSVNRNNRFYPKTEYSKHVSEMQKRIDKYNNILGEMEHPQSMNIDYNNVSHKVEKVWLDESNGNVMGQVLLLDTPKGKIAQSIAKSNTPLHISSRGMGNVDESGAVTLESLVTYDLVGTPGFEQASLLKESKDDSGNVLTESYVYDIGSNGRAITLENAGQISEDIEKSILSKIDSKINEAVKNHSGISKEDILSTVKTYVTETAAPDIQDYLKTELSEKVEELSSKFENSNMTAGISEDQAKKLMDEAFVSKYSGIIQNWTINEFSPEIQKWTTNEFAPMIENWVTNEFAPVMENWTVNEFAPMIEKWTVNEFSPMIENWVTNEFAPVIEKWVSSEYSETVQNWIVKEFSSNIQDWIIKEYSPMVEAWISEEDDDDKETKADKDTKKKDDSIYQDDKKKEKADKKKEINGDDDDEDDDDDVNESKVLKQIRLMKESAKTSKSKVELNEKQLEQRRINEQFQTGPIWLRNIPESMKSVYLSLNKDAKQTIARQASVRFFESQFDIDHFWRTRNFESLVSENTNAIKRDRTTVTNENLTDFHKQLIAQTRSLRS